MENEKITHLKRIGLSNSGNYCDPITGECYTNFEKEEKMTTKIDPVCQMEVEVEGAKYVSELKGEKYYFCSAGCQREFEEDPSQYVHEESQG